MFSKKKTRKTTISWVLFALVLMALFANSSFRPFRSVLSLVPLLCLTGAVAFSELIDWGRQRRPIGWRISLVIILMAGCVGSLGFSSFQQVKRRMTHRDSRIKAIDWLEQRARAGDTILALRELAISPAEWKRLAATVTIVPWTKALATIGERRFDYIVTGEFDLSLATNPKELSDYRETWKLQISNLAVKADFGETETSVASFVWRTNEERVVILGSKLD
jgi:hypothetical protein